MAIKTLITFVLVWVLVACGRGDAHDSLGSGYYFSHTSTIGQRIIKPGSGDVEVVVETAVIDHVVDSNFVVGVRVPSVKYKCRSEREELSGSYAYDVAFTDSLEYFVLNKKDGSLEVFTSSQSFSEYLESEQFSKPVELNTDLRLRLLRVSSIKDIDTKLCSRLP